MKNRISLFFLLLSALSLSGCGGEVCAGKTLSLDSTCTSSLFIQQLGTASFSELSYYCDDTLVNVELPASSENGWEFTEGDEDPDTWTYSIYDTTCNSITNVDAEGTSGLNGGLTLWCWPTQFESCTNAIAN